MTEMTQGQPNSYQLVTLTTLVIVLLIHT